MTPDLPRTLFIARGSLSVGWYRCALPAGVLGCDWVGAKGDPPELAFTTGRVPATFTASDIASYDVVVVQQASGRAWHRAITEWRAAGATVLYEIDDWMHGVRKLRGHGHGAHFDRATVETYELCMRAADGLICSTEWLARRYRAVNPRTWTCRNGLDLRRYDYTLPARAHVGIGWAGGTGHETAVGPWLDGVRRVMQRDARTHFVSIGQRFADRLRDEFGERCLSIPFTAMSVYPAAMAHFDVALAPAGRGNFFRGKSDLRWLEASALGLPCIADPLVYPEIEHGVTGFHASTADEMAPILEELVADAELRRRIGSAAQAHVREHRSAQSAARAWEAVLREAVGSTTSAAA